jgi:DNA-binding NarL/FixJ family response regulator
MDQAIAPGAEPGIRLLVVDDHPIMREGIEAVVTAEPDIRVVAHAGDGREAIAAFEQHLPDVTLMDLQMPELGGVDAIAAIRARWPDARIVVLTTYKGDVQATRALQAGACGVLLKEMIRKGVIEAVRAAHAGRPATGPETAAAGTLPLSAREVDVLREVARGGHNREIGTRLGISEDTVKAHMKSIMSRLDAKDRTHAVTIALQRGIIEL